MKKDTEFHIEWSDEQIKEVGIHRAKLKKAIRLLLELSELLDECELCIYATTDSANIMHVDYPPHTGAGDAHQENIVASVPISIDGGDW